MRSATGIGNVRPQRLSIIALSVLAGAVSCAALAVRPVAAQTAPCDPALVPTAADPWGYRVRGDRCEGTYAQPVGGTPLIVASFTQRFAAFDPDSTASLTVRWPAADSGRVRLRAIALRRRTYYRMDAERPASAGEWEWPANLLAALELERPELGVMAWTHRLEGDTERDVLLPLRIDRGEATDSADDYALVVVPQVELTEVWVSISRMDADGMPVEWLRDEEPLGYGYYPADGAIEIAIARPARPGLYRVQLGARIRAGGSLATEFWFQRAPD
jgi:hypothetical protein